jgi:hypothetical protein
VVAAALLGRIAVVGHSVGARIGLAGVTLLTRSSIVSISITRDVGLPRASLTGIWCGSMRPKPFDASTMKKREELLPPRPPEAPPPPQPAISTTPRPTHARRTRSLIMAQAAGEDGGVERRRPGDQGLRSIGSAAGRYNPRASEMPTVPRDWPYPMESSELQSRGRRRG